MPVKFVALIILSISCCRASAATSDRTVLQADLVHDRSQWEELDAHGNHLLGEQGELTGLQLRWQHRTELGPVAVHWTTLSGPRDYDGLTNLGRPARTTVHVELQTWTVQWLVPLTTRWQLVLDQRRTSMDRALDSTADATGYVEQWIWWQTSAGARWSRPLGAGELTLDGRWGRLHHSQVGVQLPSADPVTLRPAPGAGWQASIGYRHPLSAGPQERWLISAEWQWQRLHLNASDTVPLTRNGILRGGATQPQTRTRDQSWRLGMQWLW